MGNYGLTLPPGGYAVQKLNPVFADAAHCYPFNEIGPGQPCRDIFNPNNTATVNHTQIAAGGPVGLVRRTTDGAAPTNIVVPGAFNDNNWTALLVVGTRNWDQNIHALLTVGDYYRIDLQMRYGLYPSISYDVNNTEAVANFMASGPMADNRNHDYMVVALRNSNRNLLVDYQGTSLNTSGGGTVGTVLSGHIHGNHSFSVCNSQPAGTVFNHCQLIDQAGANAVVDGFIGGFTWWNNVKSDAQVASLIDAPFQAWPSSLGGAGGAKSLSRARGL